MKWIGKNALIRAIINENQELAPIVTLIEGTRLPRLPQPREVWPIFDQKWRVVTSQNRPYLKKIPTDFKKNSRTMSNCCMRRPAKFHVDSAVRFWAIANIREGGGRLTPPPVKRGVKSANRFSKGTRFARCFFTPSQQVSLEITKSLFVSRGTVCASPLFVSTGTAPVPWHFEIMFSTERCPFVRRHQQFGLSVRSLFTCEIRLMTVSLPRRVCQPHMAHYQQVEHKPRGCCDQAGRLALSSSETSDDRSLQDVLVCRLTGGFDEPINENLKRTTQSLFLFNAITRLRSPVTSDAPAIDPNLYRSLARCRQWTDQGKCCSRCDQVASMVPLAV